MAPVKAIRQTAPADIAGKGFLFLRGRQPVLIFNLPQSTDRRGIGGKLLARGAHAKLRVGNTEIMPFLGRNLRVEGAEQHTLPLRLGRSQHIFFFGGYSGVLFFYNIQKLSFG